MYYERLEQTDKAIEDILQWRDAQIKMIGHISNMMLELTLKQLGDTVPQEVKEARRGRPNNNRPDIS